MKVTLLRAITFVLIATFSFFLFYACEQTPKEGAEAEADVVEETPAYVCPCDDSWFPHSQTPPPAEGQGSPFDTSSTTNCIFQQWAAQKFLWATKPVNGEPLFINEMIQVDSKFQPMSSPNGKVVLTATGQAGGGGILVANPDYNSSSAQTIYYAMYVNSTLRDAAEKYYAQIVGDTAQYLDNTFAFPVGSVELKTAWVNINAIPEAERSNYFTTTGAVGSDGHPEQVALLGMHILGIVINHPEFIWATYEHQGMGPNFNWNDTTQVSDASQALLFGKGSTTGPVLNAITWDKKDGVVLDPNKAYTMYENGVPRLIGNTFMETSQKNEPEANLNNVLSVAECVNSKLDDVWNNYYFKGALWLNMDGKSSAQQVALIKALGGTIGNVSPGKDVRGCTALSNLTMETFQQTLAGSIAKAQSVNEVENCFTCHSSTTFLPGTDTSPLYLSHVFNGWVYSTVKEERKLALTLDEAKVKQMLENHAALRAAGDY